MALSPCFKQVSPRQSIINMGECSIENSMRINLSPAKNIIDDKEEQDDGVNQENSEIEELQRLRSMSFEKDDKVEEP